jgi:hypothetical protein
MPNLNSPIITGDVSGGLHTTSVDKLKGRAVASTAPTSGQVLTWDGSTWAPATASTGGGGGANGLTYYLNQSTDADAPVTGIPGTPKQLGRSGQTTQVDVTTGSLTPDTWTLVAGFVTEATPQDPAVLTIPAGLWDFNIWALGVADQNHSNSIRLKAYIYNGTTLTALGTSAVATITGTSAQYAVSMLVEQTTLLATDRIYVAIEALATANGHTVTAQFGDNTPSHVHTSLPLVGGTGLWKNVAGVLQSPASLLVDADVDAAAAIAQSKISGLTDALANVSAPGINYEFFEQFFSTSPLLGNLTFGATGGTNTAINTGFGTIAMSTGTTAAINQQARLIQATNAQVTGASAARVIFRAGQGGATWFDNTLTGAFRCGWGDSVTGESGNGIYFRVQNGQAIEFVTRLTNAETLTSTGVSFSNGTFQSLEILINAAGTQVVAKINGVTVATHTTNIPAGRLIFFSHINRTSATGTAVIANMDFVYLRVTPNTPFF